MVSFKVYFLDNDATVHKEVRRFDIDADIAHDVKRLREKLQTIVPSLQGKNYSITWYGRYSSTFSLPFPISSRTFCDLPRPD